MSHVIANGCLSSSDEAYARQLAAEQDEIDEEMIRFTQAQYEKELKAKVEQEKRYG